MLEEIPVTYAETYEIDVGFVYGEFYLRKNVRCSHG